MKQNDARTELVNNSLFVGCYGLSGFFWLGSKDDYDQLMQAGVLRVFFERAGGISLFGLGLALPWWLLNWLLVKSRPLKTINLKALALQLSVAAVAGAVCGTALFCWH